MWAFVEIGFRLPDICTGVKVRNKRRTKEIKRQRNEEEAREIGTAAAREKSP